jgi:hypothetical protein
MQTAAWRLFRPLAPVGRVDCEPPFGGGVDPATRGTPAREHKRMRTVLVDDSKLKVTIEWRG